VDTGMTDAYSRCYAEAEDLYRALLQPGARAIRGAYDPVISARGDIAFAGLMHDELRGPFQQTRLCLMAADGQVRVLAPSGGADLSPRFHPGGRLLSFRSDRARAGEQQLWFYDLDRDAIERGPAVPGCVEALHWDPDGSRLLLLVAPYGADTAGAHGSSPYLQSSAAGSDWQPRIRSFRQPDPARAIWLAGRSGEARRLTEEAQSIWEAAWCGPKAIAAIASNGASEDDWYKAELVLIDAASGSAHPVYRPRWQLGALSASPDGKWIAAVEAVCSDRALVAGELRLLDAGSGKASKIDTAGVDVAFTAFSSERCLLVLGVRGTELVAGAVDLPAGGFRELWSRRGVYGTQHYPVLGPRPGHDGAFAIALQGYATPHEIGVVDDACGYRTVASFAPAEAAHIIEALGEVREVSWQAPDGLEIQGYLIRPERERAGPLIMDIHGGPVSLWYPFWPGRYVHHLMLRRRGYAFLLPNPRGSAGRGQAFAHGVYGAMGGPGDTGDLTAGIDRMIADGIADPDRIGVMGLSYGGYMTSWLVTQDQRFAAAVAVAPISNWVSQHFTSNVPCFDNDFLGGDCFDAGPHLARSPVLHARKARAHAAHLRRPGPLHPGRPGARILQRPAGGGRAGRAGDLSAGRAWRAQLPGDDRFRRARDRLVRGAYRTVGARGRSRAGAAEGFTHRCLKDLPPGRVMLGTR
jgi:dipeptidyl aminopeptidase/acylaminoacyl peptidase